SVLAVAPDAARLDLRILGTDIDPLVLQAAQRGVYDAKICTFPNPALEGRIFARGDGEGERSVRAELKALVTFRHLNLVQPWPISGRFDVILCRNVVIYFDKPTQRHLWSRFAEVLHPGGWLLIGHSERIAEPAEIGLGTAGITTYRRAGTLPGKALT
ncbi:MAG: chemotaxis protein, partial [Gammaproteobacteria bacterium]|nr:chemotaxis protein [Gammaproteobacteria bacterium]